MMKFLLLLVSALFFIEGSTSSPINTKSSSEEIEKKLNRDLYIATRSTREYFVSYKNDVNY